MELGCVPLKSWTLNGFTSSPWALKLATKARTSVCSCAVVCCTLQQHSSQLSGQSGAGSRHSTQYLACSLQDLQYITYGECSSGAMHARTFSTKLACQHLVQCKRGDALTLRARDEGRRTLPARSPPALHPPRQYHWAKKLCLGWVPQRESRLSDIGPANRRNRGMRSRRWLDTQRNRGLIGQYTRCLPAELQRTAASRSGTLGEGEAVGF